MQQCARCGNNITNGDPRGLIDNKVYHLFCAWKIHRDLKEKESGKIEEPSDTRLPTQKRTNYKRPKYNF